MTREDLERLRDEHEATFGPAACPDWVRDSLARYVDHGIPPGDCLRAVLANDLQDAFGRADVNTARSMAAIVAYIYNDLPGPCHGSYEAVDAWIADQLERRRLEQEAEDNQPTEPDSNETLGLTDQRTRLR